MVQTALFSQYFTQNEKNWRIVSDESHILRLELTDSKDKIEQPSALTQLASSQLGEYFASSRKFFDLPLRHKGTTFQNEVWKALLEIPYGHTWTYKQLANYIGNVDAVRAVGAANGKNPLPIFIPCHRVVASNGKLHGFSLGLDVKRQLLDLEFGNNQIGLFIGS